MNAKPALAASGKAGHGGSRRGAGRKSAPQVASNGSAKIDTLFGAKQSKTSSPSQLLTDPDDSRQESVPRNASAAAAASSSSSQSPTAVNSVPPSSPQVVDLLRRFIYWPK